MYRYVVALRGGAAIAVAREEQQWISLVPLPPMGETVGMPFEIRDWVTRGDGLAVADGIRLVQLDKYVGASVQLDPWARAWVRQRDWPVEG